MSIVQVTASKNYDIIISAGLLTSAGGHIRNVVKGGIAAIVTDDIVDGLYGAGLEKSLSNAGFATVKYVINNGEASKNAANFIALLNFFAENRMTRADVVVALGGGVVGDLAGFAAASYMRGTHFAQMPTTLLAAVDSSVGGKTAIDLGMGKNLAGAFYQPDVVLCDYALLDSLLPAVFADGCAEAIKHGMIADAALFEKFSGDVHGRIGEIITRSVEIKRDVVCQDEFEMGVRKLLNFGHTVGHAIETCSDYGVSHGAAVAAGMAVITRAAVKSGLCAEDCYSRLVETLEKNNLQYKTQYTAAELFTAALADKKRSGDTITIVLPERIGKCFTREIAVSDFEDFISLGLD